MKNGQTLIEVLIGLAVAVIIISSMTGIVITTLSNVNASKTQNLASQYALEGMEIARRLRDNDYQTFSSLNGLYCLAKTCTILNNNNADPCGKNATCTQNVDTFIRQVNVVQNAGTVCRGGTKITVTVSWSDAKCGASSYCHSTQLISCFNSSTIAPP